MGWCWWKGCRWRLSVVLTAQNRGCAGCPNCLCSWPGWARAGPGATEPSWSRVGSFSSPYLPLFPLFFSSLHSVSVLFYFPHLPLLLLHLQFSEPGRADPTPRLPFFSRGNLGSELIFHFLPFQSLSFPLFSLLSLPLPVWDFVPLPQAGCLVISAAEANGPVARGWRRSGGRRSSRSRCRVPLWQRRKRRKCKKKWKESHAKVAHLEYNLRCAAP